MSGVPDISPIQFWKYLAQTFNERNIKGIDKKFYYELIGSEQILKIPYYNDDNSEVVLHMFGADGELIAIFPFARVSDYHFIATVNFAEYPELVDTKVSFLISKGHYNSGFLTETLDPVWEVLAGDPTLTRYTATTNGAFHYASLVYHLPVVFPTDVAVGESVTFRMKMSVAGAGGAAFFNAILIDMGLPGGNDVSDGGFAADSLIDGAYDFTFALTRAVNNTTGVETGIRLEFGGAAGISVLDIAPSIYFSSADGYTDKSDCCDVLEDYEPSVLIKYTNKKNYDGVDFETNSDYFTILLRDSYFYKEVITDEEEDHKTSIGTVEELRSEITLQRELNMYGFAPDHMHRKRRKILQLNTIAIDGLKWRKQGAPYEQSNVDTSTLNYARVVLTQYDGVLVNMGGEVDGRDFSDDYADDFE